MPRSPWRRIRLVTIIRRIGLIETRLGRLRLRRLDTSNGCQDHTVCPSATTRLRQKASPGFGAVRLRRLRSLTGVSSMDCLPCDPLPRADAAASTASRPNVRDDGQRPSQRGGTAGGVLVIWGEREAECFCRDGWTGNITLGLFGKLSEARRRF